ncbi:hypothetical protein MAMC_00663 [Methylacidimicrobium cyclopophantes]|uniref:Transposase putative helix-turn-helix domain-containing protein n=1 Tax=Methylacidimicrobium cyclopophantes TaxID=1041766 RepID=A0A5E6M871_9BACT|nr:hypothetical protein MAMC_00663 [Methylacidimicrobium cyclopophantes]
MRIAQKIVLRPNDVQASYVAKAAGRARFAYSRALAVREWRCPACGVIHDRELNAAIQLRNLAVSSPVSACGEEGAGRRRKTAVKPASTKREIGFEP